MSERGVFAVDRGVWDHPLLDSGEPYSRREAWMWLISAATWKARSVFVDGRRVELARGQLAHSIRFLAEKWGWSKSAVARFLEALKTDTMIGTDGGTGITIITINNYDKYQRVSLPDRDTERDDDRDMFGTPAGHQRDKEEDRKYKENREDKSSLRSDSGGRVATRPIAEPFEEFWKAYPKRDGANPKQPALKVFTAAVKAGTEPAEIVEGARRYAAFERDRGNVGTPFVPQAVKWLRNRCWNDYAPAAGANAPHATGPPAHLTPEQRRDWENGWRPGMPTRAELEAKNLGKTARSPAPRPDARGGNGPDHQGDLLAPGPAFRAAERH